MPITTAVETPRSQPGLLGLIALRLGILTAIPLAARLAWLVNHAEKWDSPPQAPLLILYELPLLVALFFVTRKERRRVACGAGITSAIALTFSMVAFPLNFVTGMTIWDTGERLQHLVALRELLPLCFLASLWLLVSAVLQGKGNGRAFFASFGIAVACLVAGLYLTGRMSVPGSGLLKEKKAYERPTTIPDKQVRALTACLLRHQFLHPKEGFPNSLKSIQPDWNCDPEITRANAFPRYWIFYSPGPDQSTRQIVDFCIQAVPTEKGRLEPVASDSRGEILKIYGPAASNAQRKEIKARGSFAIEAVDAGSGLWPIYAVRNGVREFMLSHDSEHAPPSLDGFLADDLRTRLACNQEEEPKERFISARGGRACYSIGYFPPSGELPKSFAISATCKSYGEECIRSYFLDYGGNLHATAEPRPATAQDQGLLPCELAQICQDSVWTSSAQEWDWMFLKAEVLYSVSSSNWW